MVARPPNFRPPAFGRAYAPPGSERESAAKRGYGRAWRAIRAAFLRDHPHCQCGAPASEVDHIVSLRRGGSNSRLNLQALCKPCHARKTVTVDGALGHSKNRSKTESVDPHPNHFRSSTEFMFGGDDGTE